MRPLITFLAIAFVLAACGTETVPEAPGEGVPSRANCEVAFQQIETGTTIERLESNVRALDATIEDCPSVDVWIEFAGEHLPDVDMTDAEAFLAARCDDNPDLAETVLCEGV